MEGTKGRRVWLIISLVVLVLLGGAATAHGLILALGDWEDHGLGLTYAVRIIWAVWALAAASVLLTRVTIFGWSFRRYFRWEGEGEPPPGAPRPTRAPWYKSPAASFGFTVAIVSITGVAALTTVVLWLLPELIQPDVFWLVIKIVWGAWWVALIALVLARVTVFGIERRGAMGAEDGP